MKQRHLVIRNLNLSLAFICVLSSCSAGRIEQPRLIPTENFDGIRVVQTLNNSPSTCFPKITASERRSINHENTVFVHPGLLLLGFNWDQSLAVEAGNILAEQKMTGRMLELRDRDPLPIYHHALYDPGTEFIGIHYSMGGRPDILRGSLDAIKKASRERQIPLRYHAILFDPFGISEIRDHLDINEPELGYVFILLSAEYSFLRPGIHDLTKAFADSGKLIFVFAEDFKESWNHFGMLHAFREYFLNNPDHDGGKKMDLLFKTMVAMALGDSTAQQTASAGTCVELGSQTPRLVSR